MRIMVRQSMGLNIHRDTCTDNVNVGSYKDEVYLSTFLNRDSAIIVEGIIYTAVRGGYFVGILQHKFV